MWKRIFGWLLFAWMLACLVGMVVDSGPAPAGAVGTWMKIGTGSFLAALGGIGLMMGLGLNTTTGPPEKPPSDPDTE